MRIIILMYNKQSCPTCGTYLTSVSLCEVCYEQISWICTNCDRRYDVTHLHNVILEPVPKIIGIWHENDCS